MFWTIFFVIATAFITFFYVTTVLRIDPVADYRIDVISRIHAASILDINKAEEQDLAALRSLDLDWRWRAYEDGPGFNKMMVMFWKPLKDEAWYENTDFLETTR